MVLDYPLFRINWFIQICVVLVLGSLRVVDAHGQISFRPGASQGFPVPSTFSGSGNSPTSSNQAQFIKVLSFLLDFYIISFGEAN